MVCEDMTSIKRERTHASHRLREWGRCSPSLLPLRKASVKDTCTPHQQPRWWSLPVSPSLSLLVSRRSALAELSSKCPQPPQPCPPLHRYYKRALCKSDTAVRGSAVVLVILDRASAQPRSSDFHASTTGWLTIRGNAAKNNASMG